MKYLLATVAFAMSAPLAAQVPAEAVTVIHAGTVHVEPGKAPRRNASIVVRGRTIAEVRDGFVDVPGARVVDLRAATVLPGLIDSHVHLRGLDDRLRARLEENQRDNEDNAYTALSNARKTLLAGFTTVRDLGGDPRLILSLRDAINAGDLAGPTIISAGRVSVSGGHGDGRNGVNRELASLIPPGGNTCNGADDCRRAVREQVGAGADVIKFSATGGVLSNVPGGLNQQMMDDEMRAVVETAKMFGRKVAAHAHGVGGVNAALYARVDSIDTYRSPTRKVFGSTSRTGFMSRRCSHPAAALCRRGARALTTGAI